MAHKYFYTYCALSGERSLLFPYLVKTFPPNITSTFKHIGNLKEIYRDHSYTHHLDSTINISLYLSHINPSIYPYVYPLTQLIFWMSYKVNYIH